MKTIKTKEVGVYKGISNSDGQQPGKEVVRAYEILMGEKGKLEQTFRGERDFTMAMPKPLDRFWRRYCNQFKYPDGWQVGVVTLPDESVQDGGGYHKISVVASTVEGDDGVREAMRRAAEVKTKVEKAGAQITKETVVVLSGNIPFEEARKYGGKNYSGSKSIMVFSVKNALGVAKVVLNKLANFFSARARAILHLPNLKEGALKDLAYLFLKRAEKLAGHVEQLKTALIEGSRGAKRRLQKLLGQSYALINMAITAKVKFGTGRGKLWVYDDDLTNPGYLRDKVQWAADFQGIDLYRAEDQMAVLAKAKRVR